MTYLPLIKEWNKINDLFAINKRKWGENLQCEFKFFFFPFLRVSKLVAF